MRRDTATQHLRIKRNLVHLDERDPSLINLPVPLPSVPVLTPLLSPLVGGKQPAPSSSPSPPASDPSSGGDGGDSSGGGESNGGGGGGNSDGGDSSGGDTGGGSDSSGSGSSGSGSGDNNGGGSSSSGGGSSNDGGSSSSGGGSSNGGGGDTGSSGGQGSTGSSTGASGSGSTDGSNSKGGASKSSSAGESNSTGGTPSSGTPSGSEGGASVSNNGTTTGGVVNAASQPNNAIDNNDGTHPSGGLSALGSTPSQTVSVASGASGITGATGTAAVTGAGSSGGASSVQNPSATNSVGSDAGSGVSKHGLSSGGIAGIVVVLVLALIAVAVFVLRRRNIARRSERRDKWFVGAAGYESNHSFQSGSGAGSGSMGQTGGATAGSGTASQRSSFATNFDHGLQFRAETPASAPQFDLSAVSPEFPPMAEVRGNHSVVHNVATTSDTKRYSADSNHSNNSQYLDMPNMSVPGVTTPMSVRPFSPSESFSFPKPPGQQSADRNHIMNAQSPRDNDWLTNTSPNTPSAASGRTITPQQFSTFSNANNIMTPTMPAPTANPNDIGGMNINGGSSYYAIPNPFADATPAEHDPDFDPVEIIRRPFTPTLDDELSVVPGDSVRVVKAFDDGWAYVEKIKTSQKGLIPVDCMREAGQDLPAFLASKRVSSYIGDDLGFAV